MQMHEVNLDTTEAVYILPISDMHIGDPNFNEDKFFGYRKWILENPTAYVILNGDIMNTAIKDSVSDVYGETMNPQDQLRYAKKIFEPIADRILAIVRGNHEERIMRSTGIDTCEILAAYLGVYYAGDEALLKLRFGRRPNNGKPVTYIIYATHGWGGGRTSGGKVNNLQKLADIVEELATEGVSVGNLQELRSRIKVLRDPDYESQVLDMILYYIKTCIRDHALSQVEKQDIQKLLTLFQITEGDFYRLRHGEIADLLAVEVNRIILDGNLEKKEDFYQTELQRLLGLSYDQYVELTREYVTKILDSIGADSQADQNQIQIVKAAFLISG